MLDLLFDVKAYDLYIYSNKASMLFFKGRGSLHNNTSGVQKKSILLGLTIVCYTFEIEKSNNNKIRNLSDVVFPRNLMEELKRKIDVK